VTDHAEVYIRLAPDQAPFECTPLHRGDARQGDLAGVVMSEGWNGGRPRGTLRSMGSGLSLSGVTDLEDILISWQEQYASEATLKQYERACARSKKQAAKKLA
jgi:hypothetical protein